MLLLRALGDSHPLSLELPPLGKSPTHAHLVQRVRLIHQSLSVAAQLADRKLLELERDEKYSPRALSRLRHDAQESVRMVLRYWELRLEGRGRGTILKELEKEGFRVPRNLQQWDRGEFPLALQRLHPDWRNRSSSSFHIPRGDSREFSFLLGAFCGKSASVGRAEKGGDPTLAFYVRKDQSAIIPLLEASFKALGVKLQKAAEVRFDGQSGQASYTRIAVSNAPLRDYLLAITQRNTRLPQDHPALESLESQTAFLRGFFTYAGSTSDESCKRLVVKKHRAGYPLLVGVARLLSSHGAMASVRRERDFAVLECNSAAGIAVIRHIAHGTPIRPAMTAPAESLKAFTAFQRLVTEVQEGSEQAAQPSVRMGPVAIAKRIAVDTGIVVPPWRIRGWLKGAKPPAVLAAARLEAHQTHVLSQSSGGLGVIDQEVQLSSPHALLSQALERAGGSLALSEKLHINPMRIEAWEAGDSVPTWPEVGSLLRQFAVHRRKFGALEVAWHLDFAASLKAQGLRLPGRMLIATIAKHFGSYREFLPQVQHGGMQFAECADTLQALSEGRFVPDERLKTIVGALPISTEQQLLLRFVNQQAPDEVLAVEAVMFAHELFAPLIERRCFIELEQLLKGWEVGSHTRRVRVRSLESAMAFLRGLSGLTAGELFPSTGADFSALQEALTTCDWNSYPVVVPNDAHVKGWLAGFGFEPLQRRHWSGLIHGAQEAVNRGESPRLFVLERAKSILEDAEMLGQGRRIYASLEGLSVHLPGEPSS